MWAAAPVVREQMVLFERRLDDALALEHPVRLGQPAIHPRVLASVLLYGLMTRIRSSRSLEEALEVRLDFMWLVEGRSIDHSTLSEFRRKFPDELRDLFVQVCQLAREMEVLSFERLAFDGTRVRANNRRSGTRTPQELLEERAELAEKYTGYSQQAETEDARDEEAFGLQSPHKLPDAPQRGARIQAALAELDRLNAAGFELPNRLPVTVPESRLMPNKEGGFAVIKQKFDLRRFLLRGLARVTTEWRWATTAFNLDRLISILLVKTFLPVA